MDIEDYSIDIDGSYFYGQQINDQIKKYDKVRITTTGQGDDYETACLLDYVYFEKGYELIAADLSKQKLLDANSRVIQQTVFTGTVKIKSRIYYIFEQSKETMLNFYEGTAKVL